MAIKPTEMLEETMIPKPCPIPKGLVPPTPEAVLIEGGVACGKTARLVERAAQLVQNGADAADILVFCATPDASATFAARLAQACPEAAGVRVTTPREWCLGVLAHMPSKAAGGRVPRLLAPFENDVLMEDLKTCGMRPKRLKEMLRFFYKSMTELCDWDEEWLLTGEEIMTYGLLRECLDFEGAILEPELANAVARWLHDDAEALAGHAVAHVLVDDYQLLSRASQVLANLLAAQSIAVAANPVAVAEVFESYPYAGGVEEFAAANPGAQRLVLSRSFACGQAVRAANGILSDPLLVAPGIEGTDGCPELRVAHAENPDAEAVLVADLVCEALASGTLPGDVAVAVPNAVWGRRMAAALQARGVRTARSLSPRCVSGDLRELDRCVEARVLTALYLVADPDDGVAWRSWCGFGDLFTCSSAVKDVREAAKERGIAAAEALRSLARNVAGDVNRAEWARLGVAQEQARALIEGAEGKAGEEFLGYLARFVAGEGAPVPAAVLALTAPFGDGRMAGDAAADMAARARLRLDAPRCGLSDAVRVVSLAELAGTTPRTLVVCGFVNGFFPQKGVLDLSMMVQEDADKQMAKDLRLLVNAVGKPTKDLVLTVFDEAPLELAERMKMKIRRVQLHDGLRVALSQPSVYIDAMSR